MNASTNPKSRVLHQLIADGCSPKVAMEHVDTLSEWHGEVHPMQIAAIIATLMPHVSHADLAELAGACVGNDGRIYVLEAVVSDGNWYNSHHALRPVESLDDVSMQLDTLAYEAVHAAIDDPPKWAEATAWYAEAGRVDSISICHDRS